MLFKNWVSALKGTRGPKNADESWREMERWGVVVKANADSSASSKSIVFLEMNFMQGRLF